MLERGFNVRPLFRRGATMWGRGVGAAVTIALLSAFVCAAAATAARPRLVLKQYGGAPLTGTNAFADFSIGENGGRAAPFTCFSHGRGPLKNDAPTVTVRPNEEIENRCYEEHLSVYPAKYYTMTGAVRVETVSWTGAVSITGRFTITQPGPCIYVFERIRGTQAIAEGSYFGEGEVQGFLARGSKLSCAPTETEPLTTFVLTEAFTSTEPELQN